MASKQHRPILVVSANVADINHNEEIMGMKLTWRPALHVAAMLLCVSSCNNVWAIGNCPAIGQSSSCAVLITINPDGSIGVQTDPTVGPYDGDDDSLVGVVNRSGATVFGITLTGNGIFAFDGDGANGGDYAGPGVSFTVQNGNAGTVNFDSGLPNNGFLWFSLEGPPSKIRLARTVTIDPGHGFNCAKVGQNVGAVGATDFPASNPPAGKLKEDALTLAIAQSLQGKLASDGYKVVMTKNDVNSCPTFLERTNMANNAHSNIYVSVHINAASSLPFGIGAGSSVLYNSIKSSSKTLADLMAPQIASSVGVNNRGSEARNDLAVLKPTTSRMSAVLAEVARLSGNDEAILHTAGTSDKAAQGIKAGLDSFLNQ